MHLLTQLSFLRTQTPRLPVVADDHQNSTRLATTFLSSLRPLESAVTGGLSAASQTIMGAGTTHHHFGSRSSNAQQTPVSSPRVQPPLSPDLTVRRVSSTQV